MMIHHKLSEMTAVDGEVVIEADGNNHRVIADIAGITSVTLHGDLPGSLTLLADYDCDALRTGDGDGDVMRWGEGKGKAERTGFRAGIARHEGPGDGDAWRMGAGTGDAIRISEGGGHAWREGDGDGMARRAGAGDGDAWRNGSGDGDALRDGDGDGLAYRDGDGSGDAQRTGAGHGDAHRQRFGDGSAVRTGSGQGEARRQSYQVLGTHCAVGPAKGTRGGKGLAMVRHGGAEQAPATQSAMVAVPEMLCARGRGRLRPPHRRWPWQFLRRGPLMRRVGGQSLVTSIARGIRTSSAPRNGLDSSPNPSSATHNRVGCTLTSATIRSLHSADFHHRLPLTMAHVLG